MQFSILTLQTYASILKQTNGKIDNFVSWNNVREDIENANFTRKQAEGELDRFCYGFECIDRFNNGTHEIALTKVGKDFLTCLLNEAKHQSSQIAFLMRPAKRKNHWNIIIQESTFFNQKVYDLISKYKFRQGGSRDFLRCLSITEFLEFLNETLNCLSCSPTKEKISLKDCIKQVEKHGKYWASVGGKYSWYVYPQKFELQFTEEDWTCYDSIIENLIRPVEWGGGKDKHYDQLLKFTKNEKRFIKFRKAGIIRPIWKSNNIKEALFRITSPGYLMWERKKKGFIFEFCIRRIKENYYNIYLCNASDCPNDTMYYPKLEKNQSDIPSLNMKNEKEELLKNIRQILNKQLF